MVNLIQLIFEEIHDNCVGQCLSSSDKGTKNIDRCIFHNICFVINTLRFTNRVPETARYWKWSLTTNCLGSVKYLTGQATQTGPDAVSHDGGYIEALREVATLH